MKYRLKEDGRFICGVTSFGLSAGAVVEVCQTDASTNKVLIDFGGRMIDWFHETILSKFEAV